MWGGGGGKREKCGYRYMQYDGALEANMLSILATNVMLQGVMLNTVAIRVMGGGGVVILTPIPSSFLSFGSVLITSSPGPRKS